MPAIALDKQAHGLLGYSVSVTVGLALLIGWLAITGSILLGAVLSMLAGVLAGAGVNWWNDYVHDKAHPLTNTFDPHDFYAGTAGAIIGAQVVGVVAMVVWAAGRVISLPL